MKHRIEKANILIEALPYIRKFYGKTFVIKYGGAAMENKKIKGSVAQDLILMKYVGMNPILVHGGGQEITRMLNKLKVKTRFVKGLRVTSAKTMEVVEKVLVGKVNKQIVNFINKHGGKAVGLSGKDVGLIKVRRHRPGGRDIGYVGEVQKINTSVINAMGNEFIPIIAPIGLDRSGVPHNVNADEAASEIAVALKASKLLILTDVRGVMGKGGKLISTIKTSEIKKTLKGSRIDKGMIPKLKSCVDAVKRGVNKVHIIDGRIRHALLLEIFTDKGIGTQITKGN